MNDFQTNYVVVFDLDDTLYLEKNYQLSGFETLIEFLSSLYPVEKQKLEKIVMRGGDVLKNFAHEVGFPSIKESLLWFYRLHTPKILLNPAIKLLLEKLESNDICIVILTDGRSITQRQKLIALGLDKYPFFISDEYGGLVKPNNERFKLIEKKFSAKKYVYVGDNVEKDFIAPNELGWLSMGLMPQHDFIHSSNKIEPTKTQLPQVWLNDLQEIERYLC